MLILYLLFVHWVGDFIFQSRWMANNKSHNLLALVAHVVVYTVVLAAGTWLWWPQAKWPAWLAMNFAAHLCTDFFTSRMTHRRWDEERMHAFFATIGFDQWLHAAALIVTTKLVLGMAV